MTGCTEARRRRAKSARRPLAGASAPATRHVIVTGWAETPKGGSAERSGVERGRAAGTRRQGPATSTALTHEGADGPWTARDSSTRFAYRIARTLDSSALERLRTGDDVSLRAPWPGWRSRLLGRQSEQEALTTFRRGLQVRRNRAADEHMLLRPAPVREALVSGPRQRGDRPERKLDLAISAGAVACCAFMRRMRTPIWHSPVRHSPHADLQDAPSIPSARRSVGSAGAPWRRPRLFEDGGPHRRASSLD